MSSGSTTPDKQGIADLVATHGSSSATAWLEFERYKLWSPSPNDPIPESSFPPIQGYMEKDPYVFAWGNPLVSDSSALSAVAKQFVAFCEERRKRPVWACVDRELEEILGGPEFGWSTVSCIYEDVVDPAHVIELTSANSKGQEGQKAVKDLKKNLYRAAKYDVKVKEVRRSEWTEDEMVAVEQGIREWKEKKTGVQLASTSLQPWLDSEHRRYWLAKKDNEPVGILILTPIQACAWQIKNALSFPSAPKGTSEALIYTALKDLHTEEEEAHAKRKKIPHPVNGYSNDAEHPNAHSIGIQPSFTSPSGSGSEPVSTSSESDSTSESGLITNGTSSLDKSTTSISSDSETSHPGILTPVSASGSSSESSEAASDDKSTDDDILGHDPGESKTRHRDANKVTVTFGISASPDFTPIRNLGGWKVKALSKTYGRVASGAKLIRRGEFRNKFDSEHDPMYVCYPPDGFGLEGVNALLKVLRK